MRILNQTTALFVTALLSSVGCIQMEDSTDGTSEDGSETSTTTQVVFSGSYLVEVIEQFNSIQYPVFPALISNDSSSLGWICGYDAGKPPDKIYEWYYLSNAYVRHSALAYKPKDAFGSCLSTLTGSFSARVYSDNSIRMCVGATRYNYCAALFTPSYTSLGLGPL
jgi:hypothetical protein